MHAAGSHHLNTSARVCTHYCVQCGGLEVTSLAWQPDNLSGCLPAHSCEGCNTGDLGNNPEHTQLFTPACVLPQQ